MKKFLKILALISLLVPSFASASSVGIGGPFFDDSPSSGYGGRVQICLNNTTITVSSRFLPFYIRAGAAVGPCQPPGFLQVVKVARLGDGTFRFLSNVPGAIDFSITTQNGTGSITGQLPPGVYSVRELPQRNWTTVSNTCSRVRVMSGQTSTCVVTNDLQRGTIAGTVYTDPAGNGILNQFSSFFNRQAGVRVYVDLNHNGSFDNGEPSDVSGYFGWYSINDVPPNTALTVREVVPSGFSETYPSSQTITLTLNPGQIINNQVFANRRN